VADGATVVVPNYALCPSVTIEAIALQMVRALAWTCRHAGEFGGDASRIAVAGHSAGGHLAAMLLSCRWKQVADDLPPQPFSGALAISGLYDLEPVRLAPFLQADLRLTPQQVARCSPAFFPRPKGGKLYAVVGADESDEFLRHNQLIRDQWGPTAVPVAETVPGTNHFTVLESLVDPKGRLHELALRLLGLR
jgi:arylformamidase